MLELESRPQIESGTVSRSPFWTGVLNTIPLAIPGIPFGFILGLAIASSPIDSFPGWFGAWFIFGGAAQLTMITLLTDGATTFAAVLAGLVVNARHVMYSIAMATQFQSQPRWFRWVGPFGLIDQVFALSDSRRDVSPKDFRHFYIGSVATMLIPWMLWVALGITIGASIPSEWNLAFAVPVLFIGLVVLGIRGWAGVIAATVGFNASVLLNPLPNRSGLLIGAMLGVAIAAFVPLPQTDEVTP